MEEDTEYKKLPIDDRCTHKLWKARVDGYEEAAKVFREIDDEKSPEWNKFLGLIKKFVSDSNAMAQEKGLEATLIFVENCGHAGKTVGEVISAIVSKCIAAPRTKTKDLAVQIALMYVEIEKHEITIEELIKGMDHKNPKIVAACISTVTLALKQFGSKVVSVKPIIKKITTLLSDRDKGVRDESKQLTVEIFRWIGAALKPQLASLPPVLVTELEAEFDKVKSEKPVPTRYLKSQQEKAAAAAVQSAQMSDEIDDGDGGDAGHEEIDPMDFIDPVDILSKIPKDFYEKLEAKKWQERKESLEALETLLQNPKLESGDYGDVVRALKKVLTKDSNVVLVAMSGKCLASLSKGLGKRFAPYATACVQGILEKFKEKKPNVVTALREAIDNIYPSTNLDAIQEDIIEALNNKNPSVKAETASFLARSFTKTLPTVLNKKLLKLYVTALLKTLNEPDPTVRDASAEALGTAKKLVGDKAITPYLTDVDALKMAKINECCEKAVIVIKIPGVKKERPATAPANKNTVGAPKGGSADPKPVTRPATATGAKKLIGGGVKKTASGSSGLNQGNTGLAKSASSAKALPTERDMSPEEIEERATEILPPDVLPGLADAAWKTRQSAMETFIETVNGLDSNCGHSQILIRVLVKKPGLKDTNIMVGKLKLDAVKLVAEKMGITVTTADYIMQDITEKLGDIKTMLPASQALTAIAEALKLEYAVSKVLTFSSEQKSPKVLTEALNWVNNAIKEFGFQVNPKAMIEDCKNSLQHTNAQVRAAAISLIGTLYLYMGNGLMMFFENEKPALKQQIQTEFDKYANAKPPQPSRGAKKNFSSVDESEDGDEVVVEEQPLAINIANLIPRTDISGQITEALLAEIADKNWKTRNEGLTKLQGIITETKFIKSNLGDLPLPLAARLTDSNAKIAQTTIAICEQLATAMGAPFKTHIKTFLPGVLTGLGDNKVFMRQAALSCMNVWCTECGGLKEFFECEMIADALKTGSPALKIELYGWLAEKLKDTPVKQISKDELNACIPHLYANICDRNADVRKNSNEAVLGFMIHLGFEGMVKALDKQKPTSKKDIQAALDKARPFLPVKPLPKNKQQAPIIKEERDVKSGSAGLSKTRPSSSAKGNTAAGNANAAANSSKNKKSEEEVDTSPLLAVNNLKNQRLIDEQKLRILKWTFTNPREEFIDLLRDQMSAASVNRGLMANMFHDDFRYHLKVIDSLQEDFPNNEKALICNLDLILKWLTLRFYDTNPSVLLKALDYVGKVFQRLNEIDYGLADNEGSAFLPHLLLKLGDPKDAVRNGVRDIVRKACPMFPLSKVFNYIMEGLKSKNARQRAESLEELSHMIYQYTLTLCMPVSQAPLKEIARHISDRDNSVRSAALNCVVTVYFEQGEKTYKLIGQLSDKDISMLEERIKRAKRPARPDEANNSKNNTTVIKEEDNSIEEQDVENELPSEEISPVLNRTHTSPQQPELIQKKPSGPFKLDENFINEIEKGWIKSDQLKSASLHQVDIEFLHSPIKISTRHGLPYPEDKFNQLLNHGLIRSHSTALHMVMNGVNYTTSPPQQLNNVLPARVQPPVPAPGLTEAQMDPKLVSIIKNIGSNDRYTARASVNELNDILDSTEKQAVLRDYEEIYIESVLKQFKSLSTQPIQTSLLMYQPLLASILTFFSVKSLGKNLGITSIMNIMSVLLGLMADHKLPNGDDEQYTKFINAICIKILDRTNFTNLNCALIRLLKDTCSSTGLPKFTDLIMKCIWRNVKVMPERANELSFEDVLYEVHEFMSLLPSSWWAQRPSDTPLRTVKTIIHNMAKIKGSSILADLKRVPSPSELQTYLLRVLKSVPRDKDNTNANSPLRSASSKAKEQSARMTKVHETITQIFKLISDKETNQEGISRLYQFKMENPNVDFEPFLKGASPEFQKFIEDSLAEIAKQHQNSDGTPKDSNLNNGGGLTENRNIYNVNNVNKIAGNKYGSSVKDAEYYMDKLVALRSKANLPNIGGMVNHQMGHLDNKVTDENLNLNQLPTKAQFYNKEIQSVPGLSVDRRELLQQKLAELKQQK